MRRAALLVLLVLLVYGGEVRGKTRTEFRAAALFGMHFGETKYSLDFDFGGSELVFPLDQKMVGIELGFNSITGGRERWIGRVRLLTALSEPGGKFTDIDWINTGTIGRLIFSDTKSTVTGSLVDLEVEIAHLLARGKSAQLYVVVGAGYQKIKQQAVDLFGSQLDSAGDLQLVSYNGLVLTYEIRYVRPQIGLMPRFRLSRALSGELKAVISPLLHAKDIDDHILRFFQVRSDGKGLGYSGQLALSFEPPGAMRPRLFGQLAVELQHGKVDMKGFRLYYGDNVEDGYTAGEGFPVATTVSTTQHSVRLQLGLRF